MTNTGEGSNPTPEQSPTVSPPSQKWTLDGYPIVDGKFHDLSANQIRVHEGPFRGGPPSLSVYWNNCGPTTPGSTDHFFALGCTSQHSVTEYLGRVGEMLRQGKCVVTSLNATPYAVNVIITTGLSSRDFKGLLREYELIATS